MTTTKQEIIDGLEQAIVQAKRVGALLDSVGDWEAPRPAGWTAREMFCHMAAVGGMIAQGGPAMLAAPEDADYTQSTNVTQMNAATVASMKDMSPTQLVGMFETNYGKVADFVRSVPEEQLQVKKTFGQLTVPLADIISNLTVLHANHHLFEATLRVAF